MESLLRFYMHEADLPEPAVDVWLCDEHGNRIVQPDLSIWDYRLAIQYEGGAEHRRGTCSDCVSPLCRGVPWPILLLYGTQNAP